MSRTPRRWRRLLTAVALTASSTALTIVATPSAARAVSSHNPADYQQVQLALGAAELGQPISLALLPDRTALHTARDGTLRVTDPAGNTKVAGKLTVYTHDEEGLQGVGVDPNFASNRSVYLYYSPKLSTPAGDAPKSGTQADWDLWKGEFWLSRFTLNSDNTLNLASEKVVLKVASDRGQCCHAGGDIDFDAAGNLYLTTGDDTNPFESSGSAPIDERTDRNPQFDAQRSSGNTNDLRGKVLRIRVNADGSYAIPAGNLFPVGTAKTRPEIYAMGFRNPFRMSVDKPTGIVYVGDYGPDGGAVAGRGPAGQVEFDRVTAPGNYGWPYCTGLNTAAETYYDWNFATNVGGDQYNCAAPVNNSFRNTGLTNLPAAKPSWIRYGGSAGSPPEFGSGSESPMGGQVYRYNAASTSAVKFPQNLDGHYFAAEYGRKWIKTVEVNSSTGGYGAIASFPWTGTQIIDTAFGPDGAFYVLDYGTGTDNQALYRIEYIRGANRAPTAAAAANPTSGAAPLAVAFSSAGSSDPEGGTLTYSWNFGDGTSSTAANPAKTYAANGSYTATLTVRDPQGLTGTASIPITVGNTAPKVAFTSPVAGQLFTFGDTVPFAVTVTDPEDGTIDCARVTVTYGLGHDDHAHNITSKTGCSGSITIPVDGEHDADANIYGVFDAEYTDAGGITTHAIIKLQPKHRQGEHYSAQSGVQVASHTAAEGGRTAGHINSGDWISYTPYALANATSFTARVSSAGVGGTIEVRAGSATGTLLGSVAVPVTGSWETFTNVSTALTPAPGGSTALYLVFKGGTGNLFDVDAYTLNTATEAEVWTSQNGVQVAVHSNASAGRTVGYVNNADWTAYSGLNTSGKTRAIIRVASAGAGGSIQVRSGSATGTLLGTVAVPVTGDWNTFTTVTANLSGAASGQLVLVYTGAGTGYLFDVDTVALS